MKIKKFMPAVVAVIAVLVLSTSSLAGTIVQTKTFSGTPSLNRVFAFDKFNDQVGSGTLTSIQVILTLNVNSGALVLDNDGELVATGTFGLGGKCGISSSQVSLLTDSNQPLFGMAEAVHTGSFSLAANEGDTRTDLNSSGPDAFIYEGGLNSDTKSGYIGNSHWTNFIGTGTYDINLEATQWSEVSTLNGVAYLMFPVETSGNVTVIYETANVPEPSSITGLLTALAGMGFVGLRRRTK
ncbi:MAG: choice-of-anchor E domain-containing protein [Armatimonadota bacterium]